MKINSISENSGTYPARLLDLPDAPKELYYIGELPLYKRGIAIIGTRKPTSYGRQVTIELATRLAEQGAVIISGLAHGIDSIAHDAAVRARGTTLAVLAGGLDQIYPSSNKELAHRIVEESGSLISEYPAGTPPLPFRFLRRNRIVTGLADTIIVTEAGIQSGTINTVSHALEQGKEVYVVPGPITSPMSAGCNALISQGAIPLVNIDMFILQLFPKHTKKQISLLAQNEAEQTILELIADGIQEGEEIQQQSLLDGALYSQTMTMLEIRGAIHALGANRWGL